VKQTRAKSAFVYYQRYDSLHSDSDFNLMKVKFFKDDEFLTRVPKVCVYTI